MASSAVAPMELGYWKIRGLGAVFRMILEYKEAKYVEKQYYKEDWFQGRKPEILAMNPLANLPHLVDGDNCICQTNAILNYLGNKYGMNGTTDAQKIRTQELLCEIYDVRMNLIHMFYHSYREVRSKEEFYAKALAAVGGTTFAKFEHVLGFKDNLSGGKWFVLADGPGVADFHIWEQLDHHRILSKGIGGPDIFAEIPRCKAFYEAFKALPSLQKYFASEAYTSFNINGPGWALWEEGSGSWNEEIQALLDLRPK
ncbi:Glutathione S-transferase Mu 5 (GST class-mu 5) [Durusdinium trenchii]|uniref:glutathione transferase n=1 Tax=Durusdinium trenchii TaxID=1381693 RepID=A0ABP0N0R8_9DINO